MVGRLAVGMCCVRARVNDGLLDVCIVPAAADVVGTLGCTIVGRYQWLAGVALSARLAWFEVDAPQGLISIWTGADGEVVRYALLPCRPLYGCIYQQVRRCCRPSLSLMGLCEALIAKALRYLPLDGRPIADTLGMAI